MTKIARRFHVGIAVIQYRLEGLGVQRRNHSERLWTQHRFGNAIETAVAHLLDELNIQYTQSKKLGRFFYDFYLPNYSTLIECDGSFWHADPRFYPDREHLHHLQSKSIARDAEKCALAASNGYTLLRFWEHEIRNKPDWIKAQLCQLVERRRLHE